MAPKQKGGNKKSEVLRDVSHDELCGRLRALAASAYWRRVLMEQVSEASRPGETYLRGHLPRDIQVSNDDFNAVIDEA